MALVSVSSVLLLSCATRSADPTPPLVAAKLTSSVAHALPGMQERNAPSSTGPRVGPLNWSGASNRLRRAGMRLRGGGACLSLPRTLEWNHPQAASEEEEWPQAGDGLLRGASANSDEESCDPADQLDGGKEEIGKGSTLRDWMPGADAEEAEEERGGGAAAIAAEASYLTAPSAHWTESPLVKRYLNTSFPASSSRSNAIPSRGARGLSGLPSLGKRGVGGLEAVLAAHDD
eukprot:CAMPEP_0177731684 /NCGR_PEP_ID=MMETSP0484_2-20121128/22687_1 /TAXON_ID=354590 /ORGANISM="Rhodomonas lens, Strain RHODO" /LENGTH=231 /DNA_ID=CAMNT_0019244823 /DNA_START=73 /DNA_END=765 /DNA_ORIENTATION=+